MGDIESARRAFDGIPLGISAGPQSFQGDVTPIVGYRVYIDVLERRFTEAFQTFDQEQATPDVTCCKHPRNIGSVCESSSTNRHPSGSQHRNGTVFTD
jgi:hypothetical protein